MRHAFEINRPSFIELRDYPSTDDKAAKLNEIEQEIAANPWVRIRYHACRNDESLPCEQWQTEYERGTIPDPDL